MIQGAQTLTTINKQRSPSKAPGASNNPPPDQNLTPESFPQNPPLDHKQVKIIWSKFVAECYAKGPKGADELRERLKEFSPARADESKDHSWISDSKKLGNSYWPNKKAKTELGVNLSGLVSALTKLDGENKNLFNKARVWLGFERREIPWTNLVAACYAKGSEGADELRERITKALPGSKR